jgi:hypothetical protein
MILKFQSGKEPEVKFSKGDQNATATFVKLLRDFGRHFDRPNIVELADATEKAAVEIGVIEATKTGGTA